MKKSSLLQRLPLYFLVLSFSLLALMGGGMLTGCKKKQGKHLISRKEFRRRVQWAKPRCTFFCNKINKLCASFFKRKKEQSAKKKKPYRAFTLKQCRRECVIRFVKSPVIVSRSLQCSSVAKTCRQLGNCNRCANLVCPGYPTTKPSSKPTARSNKTKKTTTVRSKVAPPTAPKRPSPRPPRPAPTKR